MIQIKSIQLSWVDVAKAVSSELQKLLGRCFYCIASMDDHDYWGISIQNDRVDLTELDFVFDTVEAEDRVREDTYCDDGDVSFNALGMGLSDLLLKRSLGLDWIKEYIDREFLYLIDVKEKDSDDMSHIQLENLGVDLKQLRSMSQLLIYLQNNGSTHSALMDFCEEYREKYHNELCWPYPISDGRHLGTFLVLVKEGVLSLPYDIADEENGEIFCLSEVRLFDSGSMQEFIESWDLFDEDLHQAMYAMKKYLKNQEDQYVAQNRLGNTLCGEWSM